MRLVHPMLLVWLGLTGCGETGRSDSSGDTARADTAVRAQAIPSDRKLAGNRVAGIRFDPLRIQVGNRIGAMVLDSLALRTAYDSTRLGTAQFSGRVELSGVKLRHFDSDVDALCFEADSASAARLPRWEGDERRAWFCFTNRSAAQTALGPPGDSAPARIVIDRLTIHRGMSDEVNSAHFVRQVSP